MKILKETIRERAESHLSEKVNKFWEYSQVFDSLLEGIQIIDFSWRYVYANAALTKYENVAWETLKGLTVMERHPGIENTKVFDVLRQCMNDRTKQQIETEFEYLGRSRKWFQLSIEPIDEGIMVLSIDITARKEADEKTLRANHLYAFISQVNQNIVRVKDETTLFRNACCMALEYGKFKMAWIGMFDSSFKTIKLIDQSGIPAEDIGLFSDALFQAGGPQDYALRSGNFFICTDIENEPSLEKLKPFAIKQGIRSCMVLPIKKSGKIIGTFNLYSSQGQFSAKEEIAMLVELAADISFAVDLFEKEKKHETTEALVLKNENQFRNTLDGMIEGVQLHDFNYRYVYVNDALVKYSKYSRDELLGYTLMEKYPGIEQTELFEKIRRCMTSRVTEHLETEFVFPDGTKSYFEVSIKPIPEGIFILSIDRTEQKKSQAKLLKVNRIYAFISAINQSIVHINNEQDLLNRACTIAVDFGKFPMAWIDLIDEKSGKLNMVSSCGAKSVTEVAQLHLGMDSDNSPLRNTPTGQAMRTGKYAVSNNVQHDLAMRPWQDALKQHGIEATMSLPIKKFGKVVGIFGLHSSTENSFDEEEIILLEEAVGDISFAMELFEKTIRHRSTEKRVVENEKRFRALIEKSTDMITLVSETGELCYVSPSVTKMLGYDFKELLHKPDYEFIHPDDIDQFKRNIEAIVATPGLSFSNQQRLLHKNGHWMWCEGTVTNLLFEPGINALVSNFRDISEKKAMEQQSEFNKNNLNALINNTTDLMWSVDRDLNLITFNQPFAEATKVISGQAIAKGTNILQAGFSPEQLNRFKMHYEQAFAGKVFTKIDHKTNPIESWSEISYYPIQSENEIVGAACHARDITDIKKAEQEVRKSEAFNRGVINSLNRQIAVVDSHGNIKALNDSWKHFAKANANTIVQRAVKGMNYFKLCEAAATDGDQAADKMLTGIKSVLDGRKDVFCFEYSSYVKTTMRWFSMRIMRFNSEAPMVVLAHEDISQYKLAEENLIYNNNELQKTNKELDRFVYSASHDLRSPLCSVLGLVSLIDLGSKEPEILGYSRLIRNSIVRLDEFIKNIISYSRNKRSEIEVEVIPVKKRITEIITALSHMKGAEGIQFSVEIQGSDLFHSDPIRFNIVLENLISNAIKFQDHKKVSRYIKITGTVDPLNLNVAIEDNGIGIEPHHQTKIFDMFFRISGAREGSGIGLYIVKEALEKLQGSIQVEANISGGSSFNLCLKNLAEV